MKVAVVQVVSRDLSPKYSGYVGEIFPRMPSSPHSERERFDTDGDLPSADIYLMFDQWCNDRYMVHILRSAFDGKMDNGFWVSGFTDSADRVMLDGMTKVEDFSKPLVTIKP